MAFITRVKELVKTVAGINDSEELDIIDKNDKIDENKIEEIIMVDPKAMELLKTLSGLGNNEKKVETGIADTKRETHNEKQSGEFKRSLDVMTKILGKNKEQTNANQEEVSKDGKQIEMVD